MARTAWAWLAAAAVLLALRPALAQDDIAVDLQIIGFGVSDEVRAQLEAAATAGGGQYYAAGDEEELTQALGAATGLASAAAEDPAARRAVTLVMDVSNSMWGQIEGRAKIDIAREAIASLLTGWDAGADLGLIAYGHRRTGDCTDIEALLPPAPLDAAGFLTVINGLTPTGKTPLTEAVRQAAAALAADDRPSTIILFTDGIETCNADPCALGAELAQAGIGLTVHVVGLGTPVGEAGLACLAEPTGGLYLTADDAPQLAQALATTAAADAGDLVTLVAVDEATGTPITTGVAWQVISLASEEPVPLSAGVASPALPLDAGQYLAEARVGPAVGRTTFEVAEGVAQTVEVRLASAAPPVAAAACAEPNDSFAAPAPADLAGGIRDSVYPQGDTDFCGLDAPGAGVLTIAATEAPGPLDVIVRVNDPDRRPVRDWSGELLPGAAPVEADLPEAGRYVVEVADAYNDAASSDPYALSLAFAPAIDATEPNDSLTRPAAIAPDKATELAIFPRGEHNFLAVEVEEHGELTVAATAVPRAIDLALRVWGPDLAVLHDWTAAPAGVDLTLVVDLPAPGRYVLEVADSYDDARSPEPLTLAATFVPSADAFEPNGSFPAAAPLAFETPGAITILPRRDADYFALDAAHRGRVRAVAEGVAGIDLAMRLLDGDDRVVRDWMAAPAGVDLAFEADLPAPGRYVLQVADSYDDGRSAETIMLTVSLAAAEDAAEPNDRPRDAGALPLGAPTPATILPLRDVDYFVIDAPAAAPLTVRASGVPAGMDVALRLLDEDLDVVANWTAPPAAGVDTEMRVELPAAGRYILQVADNYDDAASPEAFTLTATQP